MPRLHFSSTNVPVESLLYDESYAEYAYIEQYVAAYQYDGDGSIKFCPIYNYGSYNRYLEEYVIIADIDGNGKAELLTCSTHLFSIITETTIRIQIPRKIQMTNCIAYNALFILYANMDKFHFVNCP
jgi:hypothetical protein